MEKVFVKISEKAEGRYGSKILGKIGFIHGYIYDEIDVFAIVVIENTLQPIRVQHLIVL